jgi:small basic protein
MWLVILLVAVGFVLGLFLNLPVQHFDAKFVALFFLAVLDALVFGIGHDLDRRPSTDRLVFIRLTMTLMFGGFIIYFGLKTGLDLYLVALLPIAFGLALNLYKFLPK